QHGCLVADALAMTTVLIHPHSGVLSAYGMGLADIRAIRSRAVMEIGAAGIETRLATAADVLVEETIAELATPGVTDGVPVPIRVHLRNEGPDTPIPVEIGRREEGPSGNLLPLPDMIAAFEAAHKRQFGFVFEGKAILVESL